MPGVICSLFLHNAFHTFGLTDICQNFMPLFCIYSCRKKKIQSTSLYLYWEYSSRILEVILGLNTISACIFIVKLEFWQSHTMNQRIMMFMMIFKIIVVIIIIITIINVIIIIIIIFFSLAPGQKCEWEDIINISQGFSN